MRVRLINHSQQPKYPSWYNDLSETAAADSVVLEAKRRLNAGETSGTVEKVSANIWREIDQIDLSARESTKLDKIAPDLCSQVDSLMHVNRFAALVAVLTWFKHSSGMLLPELAFSPVMSDSALPEGYAAYNDVLPAHVRSVRVDAIASSAWDVLSVWAVTLRVVGLFFVVALVVRFLWRRLVRRFGRSGTT